VKEPFLVGRVVALTLEAIAVHDGGRPRCCCLGSTPFGGTATGTGPPVGRGSRPRWQGPTIAIGHAIGTTQQWGPVPRPAAGRGTRVLTRDRFTSDTVDVLIEVCRQNLRFDPPTNNFLFRRAPGGHLLGNRMVYMCLIGTAAGRIFVGFWRGLRGSGVVSVHRWWRCRGSREFLGNSWENGARLQLGSVPPWPDSSRGAPAAKTHHSGGAAAR